MIETLGGLAGAIAGGCGGEASSPEREAHGSGGTGGSGSAGTGAGGSGGTTGGSGGSAGTAGTGGVSPEAGSDAAVCTVYPRQTEGPFYLDLDLLRSDVTEGKPGALLELTLRVVSAGSCAPLAGVAVDIWQCDVDGVYAGFPGQLGGLDTTGQRFLRGTQVSGEDGTVVFQTIYPGWYPGRTTHIHFKLHPSATTEVTSQLYFPEATTATVYQAEPYAARGPKDTSNLADATAQTGGMPPVVNVVTGSNGFAATLTIAVA